MQEAIKAVLQADKSERVMTALISYHLQRRGLSQHCYFLSYTKEASDGFCRQTLPTDFQPDRSLVKKVQKLHNSFRALP